MATVQIVLAGATGRSATGATMPVVNSVPVDADTLTSGASSAQADFSAPATGWETLFWSVTVTGGNVYVRFGANPTAVTEEGCWSWTARPVSSRSAPRAKKSPSRTPDHEPVSWPGPRPHP